ncbi:hypothetical protein [Haliangium sp.]|uniref:hypothetical protein n=1 Tax=Haliangium sp. TaxID=2663208 RepID=UPI003D09EBF8
MQSPYILRMCLLSLLVLAPACGGESRPGPLQHTIDEMFIAKVPLPEKQGVLQAQQDYQEARMLQNQVQAEYNDSATELEVAKNEHEQAKLDQKSAESRQKAAEESGDMNRVNAVARDIRAAKLKADAAGKKVQYIEAHRVYLKKKLLQAEDEMYAKEARLELAKARVAKANNIRPKGFDLANFERQSEERAKYAQRTKALLQREKADADKLRKEWKALQQEAARARGQGGAGAGGDSP